jgi:hypothetical protein
MDQSKVGIVKKGDRVRIKRGAKITGTFPGRKKVAGKSYVVEVFAVDPHRRTVTWPGYGGYWHTTSFDNVALVESAPEGNGRSSGDEVRLRAQHRANRHRDPVASAP